ncbi:hypothetical protein LXT21_41315 [Myxococcus sp. K38C18041901]|uniref:hypothetical protein n=1 Tax=Myxococcus guangdongensis TaxID=2906760 RepID=UPI0020A707F9|nr:hypothetical protein [Myxococcus guangdongensis]MCP3065233.1 hypothetical protein [Myxococcus guangdongensis]
MHPSGEAAWPESLRPLYEEVASTPATEAVEASARWTTSFADWVRGASLEERTLAQLATWERLARGERGLGELLFLVGSCSELLWPYAVPPAGLLERLLSRQGAMLEVLRGTGEPEVAARVLRESEAALSTVLTRYLKRHPDSLLSLVGNVPCTYDGRALRFLDSVEVDLKRVMASGNKAIGMLEQLRLLLPATAEAGRDKLADYIRTRASRIPWQEASEVLAERLFALATSPDGRGAMRGFLACYPNGRKEPDWCARAGVLLARTLEVGGSPAVVENLCELLARFDAPPVDGLRGALGALVGSDFDTLTDLGPVRFVLDHCQANLRKGEPGLVLTQVWLEERLFRASVRKGLSDAFERRKRMRAKLEPMATGFAHLCWLAEECADLWPKLGSENRPGLDELAAWRDEVAERIARKPMPRKAAIEFFLWCAPDAASSEAELVVLSLARTETDRRQVRRLKDHPSSRVRLRVRTLQRWFQGATGKDGAKAPPPTGAVAPASLTEALRHLHVTRAVPLSGRTWLRDRDLEELLFGAVSRVEADFSTRYPERFREDTVELVDSLLEALSGELGRVKADVFSLLAQGQPPPLDFELTVRRVAERVVEEPKPSRRGRGRAAAVPVATEVGPVGVLDMSTSWAPVVESVIAEDEGAGRGDDSLLMEDEVSRLLEAEALARVEASDETTLAEMPEAPHDGLSVEALTPAPDSLVAQGPDAPVTVAESHQDALVSDAPHDSTGPMAGEASAQDVIRANVEALDEPNAHSQVSPGGGFAMAPSIEGAAYAKPVGSDETVHVVASVESADEVSATTRVDAPSQVDDVAAETAFSVDNPAVSAGEASDSTPVGASSSAADEASDTDSHVDASTRVADGAAADDSSDHTTSVDAAEQVAGSPSLVDAPASAAGEASDATAHVASPVQVADVIATQPADGAIDGGSRSDAPDSAPSAAADAASTEPLPPLVAPASTSSSEVRLPDDEPAARSRRSRGKRGSSDRVPDSRTSGTEVAFVMSAEVDGFVDTERAVLVQVVKLEQRGEGQWLPHFRLGREMVDGLLSRTDSAYCLFLVPPIPRAECWLLPARLVRDLMDAQRSLTTVSRDSVARAARSLSQWWMGDFVNLWTGDERTAFLEHVSAESPNAPDFVVQCSFHSGTRTPKP